MFVTVECLQDKKFKERYGNQKNDELWWAKVESQKLKKRLKRRQVDQLCFTAKHIRQNLVATYKDNGSAQMEN